MAGQDFKKYIVPTNLWEQLFPKIPTKKCCYDSVYIYIPKYIYPTIHIGVLFHYEGGGGVRGGGGGGSENL